MAILELKADDIEAVASLRKRRLTTRQIAESLGISENMVVCAYRKLANQPETSFALFPRLWA